MIDNYDLWESREREREAWLESLPKCSHCNEPIQEEYCYEINGEYICEECMKDFRKCVDDLIF